MPRRQTDVKPHISALLLLPLLFACSSNPSATPAAKALMRNDSATPAPLDRLPATIEGNAAPCLGVVGARPGYKAPVHLMRNGRVAASTEVASPFAFKFVVPPRTYVVRGQNDPDVRVTASAGATVRVTLSSKGCD